MKKNRVILITTMILSLVCSVMSKAFVNAEGNVSIGISPMRESMVLAPGETYKGSFHVNNPAYSDEAIKYKISISPFYVNENYDPVYSDEGGNSEIAKWITVTSGEEGELEPNQIGIVEYSIEVPETAPAGGQYAAIIATIDSGANDADGFSIGESVGVAHTIFAEITGDNVVSGKILTTGIKSFVVDGKISGYSTVENTGNVHSLAVYTLEVSSLFSGEIVYSNSDMPENHFVLPDRQFENEIAWEETPPMGIFNVKYTVDYQGQKDEVTGVVVVCPWWIIAIICFGLLMLILRIIFFIKLTKRRKSEEEVIV